MTTSAKLKYQALDKASKFDDIASSLGGPGADSDTANLLRALAANIEKLEIALISGSRFDESPHCFITRSRAGAF